MPSALRAYVDRAAPQAEWRLVHRVADVTVPAVERALRTVLVLPEASTTWARFTEHVLRNDVSAAVNDLDLSTLADALRERVLPLLFRVFVQAGDAVLRSAKQRGIATRVGDTFAKAEKRRATLRVEDMVMSFDETNPHAATWAEQNAARLVTQVTDEARAAVRAYVGEAFAQGIPPRQLAKLMRVVVGLTGQQALHVARMRQSLQDEGLTGEQVDRRIEFEAAQALRRRALNIARTETMHASNAGQMEAWRQGRSEGLIDRDLVKEWIITPDARLCEICAPLEGEQRAVDQAFSWGGQNPPRHPSCRCAIGLVPQRERS